MYCFNKSIIHKKYTFLCFSLQNQNKDSIIRYCFGTQRDVVQDGWHICDAGKHWEN